MNRTIAEWAWRGSILGVLAWIGLELHAVRVYAEQPVDDQSVVASAPDGAEQDTLASIGDELAEIKMKVNAIMIVMARSK